MGLGEDRDLINFVDINRDKIRIGDELRRVTNKFNDTVEVVGAHNGRIRGRYEYTRHDGTLTEGRYDIGRHDAKNNWVLVKDNKPTIVWQSKK